MNAMRRQQTHRLEISGADWQRESGVATWKLVRVHLRNPRSVAESQAQSNARADMVGRAGMILLALRHMGGEM